MTYEQSVAHYTSRRRSCGLCEAVNPLIKQSAEEILHTLLNENKKQISGGKSSFHI